MTTSPIPIEGTGTGGVLPLARILSTLDSAQFDRLIAAILAIGSITVPGDGGGTGSGDDGLSAYQLAVQNGFTGNLTQWLASLKGADGKSAYKLAQDSGYTGSLADWIISLKGDAGLSAYQVAQAGGYTGTRSQWLLTLVGPEGKSAYKLAQDAGYTGTISEWLASLKGTKGDPGLSAFQVAQAGGYGGSQAQWLSTLKGDPGKSAYQIAQDGGYGGSQAQWLATLKGDTGKSAFQIAQDGGYTGSQSQWLSSLIGMSAYQVAVANGYSGNQTQWLASLVGPAATFTQGNRTQVPFDRASEGGTYLVPLGNNAYRVDSVAVIGQKGADSTGGGGGTGGPVPTFTFLSATGPVGSAITTEQDVDEDGNYTITTTYPAPAPSSGGGGGTPAKSPRRITSPPKDGWQIIPGFDPLARTVTNSGLQNSNVSYGLILTRPWDFDYADDCDKVSFIYNSNFDVSLQLIWFEDLNGRADLTRVRHSQQINALAGSVVLQTFSTPLSVAVGDRLHVCLTANAYPNSDPNFYCMRPGDLPWIGSTVSGYGYSPSVDLATGQLSGGQSGQDWAAANGAAAQTNLRRDDRAFPVIWLHRKAT